MGTFIIFGIIALLFILAVVKIVKDKKNGKCCGCDAGCSNSSCGCSHKH